MAKAKQTKGSNAKGKATVTFKCTTKARLDTGKACTVKGQDNFSPLEKGGFSKTCKQCRTLASNKWTKANDEMRKTQARSAKYLNNGIPAVRPSAIEFRTWKETSKKGDVYPIVTYDGEDAEKLYQEHLAEKQKMRDEHQEFLANLKAQEKAQREKLRAETKKLRDKEKAEKAKERAEQKAIRDKARAEEKALKAKEVAEQKRVKAQEKAELRKQEAIAKAEERKQAMLDKQQEAKDKIGEKLSNL